MDTLDNSQDRGAKEIMIACKWIRMMTFLTDPWIFGHLLGVVEEFEQGSTDGESQARQQDDEYSSDIIHPQSIGFSILWFIIPGTGYACILPPLVIQHLDDSLLLKIQNGQRDLISPGRSCQKKEWMHDWLDRTSYIMEIAVITITHASRQSEGEMRRGNRDQKVTAY